MAAPHFWRFCSKWPRGSAGQACIGAISSMADAAIQNSISVSRGTKTMESAIADTLISGATGALFGAFGASGSDAFENSCKMTNAAIDAGAKLLTDGLHPAVKAGLKETVNRFGRYATKEVVNMLGESAATGVISFGVSWYAGKIAENAL